MRRGNKDNALDCRVRVKDESLLDARMVRNLRVEYLCSWAEDLVPDRSARISNLHPGEQATHAVAYQYITLLEAESLLREGEVFS